MTRCAELARPVLADGVGGAKSMHAIIAHHRGSLRVREALLRRVFLGLVHQFAGSGHADVLGLLARELGQARAELVEMQAGKSEFLTDVTESSYFTTSIRLSNQFLR